MSLGWGELLVILLIVLLLVGGRRLPQVGKSIGEAIREFQRSLRGDDHDKPEEGEKR